MRSESQLIVRYAETDQMQIVHHSNYAVWYEVARTDFIKKLGLRYSQLEKDGIWLPLVKLNCHYINAAFYEDELTVHAEIETLTPARIEFGYKVYRKGEDGPINEGSTLHAFTDSNLKIMNMKKKYPEIYQLLMKAYER